MFPLEMHCQLVEDEIVSELTTPGPPAGAAVKWHAHSCQLRRMMPALVS